MWYICNRLIFELAIRHSKKMTGHCQEWGLSIQHYWNNLWWLCEHYLRHFMYCQSNKFSAEFMTPSFTWKVIIGVGKEVSCCCHVNTYKDWSAVIVGQCCIHKSFEGLWHYVVLISALVEELFLWRIMLASLLLCDYSQILTHCNAIVWAFYFLC